MSTKVFILVHLADIVSRFVDIHSSTSISYEKRKYEKRYRKNDILPGSFSSIIQDSSELMMTSQLKANCAYRRKTFRERIKKKSRKTKKYTPSNR